MTEYLQQHNVRTLLETLLQKLLETQPEAPVPFLVELLSEGGPPRISSERDRADRSGNRLAMPKKKTHRTSKSSGASRRMTEAHRDDSATRIQRTFHRKRGRRRVKSELVAWKKQQQAAAATTAAAGSDGQGLSMTSTLPTVRSILDNSSLQAADGDGARSAEHHGNALRTLNTNMPTDEYRFSSADLLGHGQFGKVYRAQHIQSGSYWAVKQIRKMNRAVISSIAEEVTLLTLLHSPLSQPDAASRHVVGFKEWFEDDVDVFVVLELVSGGDLLERVAHHGLYSESTAKHAFKQLVASLVFMHSKGVLHLDLKPDNIMCLGVNDRRLTHHSESVAAQPSVAATASQNDKQSVLKRDDSNRLCGTVTPSPDPTESSVVLSAAAMSAYDAKQAAREADAAAAKAGLQRHEVPLDVVVTDFGVSRLVMPLKETTAFDQLPTITGLFGTPTFSAPEVVQRKPYSFPSDVWSLGCILYVLLVGHPPFEHPERKALEIMIGNGLSSAHHDALSRAHVSESAKDLLCSLLCADPSKRITAAQTLQHEWFRPSDALQEQKGQSSGEALERGTTRSHHLWDEVRTHLHELTQTLKNIRAYNQDRRASQRLVQIARAASMKFELPGS